MGMVELQIELQKLNGQIEFLSVQADEELLKNYAIEYSTEYAKKNDWYRLGDYSGHVILHNFPFYDSLNLMKNLRNTSILENYLFTHNYALLKEYVPTFIDETFLWLYRHIMKTYLHDIIETISIHTTKEKRRKESRLTDFVQQRGNKEVIYYTFNNEWFAVPLDVASDAFIEDYHGYELGKDDDTLYTKIWKYRVPKDTGVKTAYINDKYLISYTCD